MTAIVLRGDAAALPLPDGSVDLIVTSPPYYGLRSYTDGGEHYKGQVGSESTPAEYVAALIACTREWVRVLKPSGSLFVNLGDKYGRAQTTNVPQTKSGTVRAYPETVAQIGTPKCLLGLPWRYALAVTDQLGLILRAEIIWAKPNGLPESVTDRVRRSHEQWFHLVRQPRYYAAVDEIREPHDTFDRKGLRTSYPPGSASGQVGVNGERHHREGGAGLPLNPLGKLPGSVWTIPSQPLTVPPHLGVDHFAAFPMEWPRRIILGWSPPGICTVCGEGRRPTVEGGRNGDGSKPHKAAMRVSSFDWAAWKEGQPHRITGYSCACVQEWHDQRCCSPEQFRGEAHPDCPGRVRLPPTRPAVVLDPFGGTGTAALIAHTLGRVGITIDRSWDYTRLAQWRTQDPAQRAQALQVPKPPVQVDGQLDMFGEAAL